MHLWYEVHEGNSGAAGEGAAAARSGRRGVGVDNIDLEEATRARRCW